MAITLIFDHVGTNPTFISEWLSTHILHGRNQSSHHDRIVTTLIYDQVGTYPSITSYWPCTYIWSCETTSHNHIKMALSPKLSIPRNWPSASIPRTAFSPYILSCRNQSYNHIRMGQHSHLQWKEAKSSHHDRMDQPLHLTMEGN